MVVFCCVNTRETNVVCILAFAECKKQWLMYKTKLTFTNALPFYDTVRHMLGSLYPKQFQVGQYVL